MLSLAWKEISRRWSRSALSICGFLLVALLITAGLCLGDAMRRATMEPLAVTGTDLVAVKITKPCEFKVVKLPKGLAGIPASALDQIRALPGVSSASGALVVWAFKGGQPDVVTGVVPDSVRSGPLRQYRSGERCCLMEEGRLFLLSETDGAVLDRTFAQQRGVGLNGTIKLGSFDPPGFREFRVVGILKVAGVAVIGGGQVYLPLAVVQEMLHQGEIVNHVFVNTKPDADLAALETAIKAIVGEGCQVSSRKSLPEQISRSAAVTAAGSTVFVVLILAIGGLLMVRAALASIRERVVEIGILRAIGWRKRHVVTLLGIEMVYQGLLGAVPGILLGYGVAFLACSHLSLALPDSFNSYPPCATTNPALALTMTPQISATGAITAFVLTVALALAAGLVAGRQAAARVPLDSLRQP